MTVLNTLAVRNLRAHADWLRRRAAYLVGPEPPDPRDNELRDRGANLAFQAAVQRRAKQRHVLHDGICGTRLGFDCDCPAAAFKR